MKGLSYAYLMTGGERMCLAGEQEGMEGERVKAPLRKSGSARLPGSYP
jgi:hypothetical protein